MAAGRPRTFDREMALEKAMLLFWDKGYEGTTMSDIIETIGMKAPSIYAAFGNKDALFREAVSLYTGQITKGPLKALQTEKNIYYAVERALEKCVELSTNPKHPTGCLIMFGAINTSPEHSDHVEALKMLRDSYKRAWEERFLQAKADGQLQEDANPGALAEYFATFIQGLALRSKDGSTKEDLIASCKLALSGASSAIRKPH